MEIEIEFFSRQIKNLRESRQLTQEALAHELGVSRQSVIALERGKCLPSLPLAMGLADLFELSLESFFKPCINEPERKEVSKMSRDLMPFFPSRDINTLHDSINRLFEESLATNPKGNVLLPTLNIFEKENNVIVEADVPGVKEEDISVEIGDDQIVIRGEKKTENKLKEEYYYRFESSFGSFSRGIGLPAEIDKDRAEAELKNGVLKIILPKIAKTESKLTKIKVKSK